MKQAETILDRSMDNLEQAAAQLARLVSDVTSIRIREPLAKRTTLRVGGPADLYLEPASEKDLAAVVKYCSENVLPILILGRGSNLLIRDGGFRGAVISLAHLFFSRIEFKADRLHCGAGARTKNVAMEAKRNGLSGVEFLEGIPGSVGGALRMNAGAMGGATFDAVESIRVMNFSGNIQDIRATDVSVEYRCCPMLKTHIGLSVVFKGKLAPREMIERRMSEFSRKRWESQPASPSAGCMFKNPPAIPAGRLIDELGLKGTRVGGAMVSLEHGNFIVNDGGATAKDILELIGLVKERVQLERGIELQTEVQIVGE